uniref:Large ribosomal subunit protein uL4c n=1 Tax=Alsidium seaforthii TaxID=2007182 RepID=A0A1Z1MDW9_9FLOR|nr:ribosomal protein L4 [Bryothamnion seaforthii]ARW63981.1 ribosomal protein L4 [Bryothamnion seaforthii]
MSVNKKLEYSVIDKINSIEKKNLHLTINNNEEKQMYCIHKALKNQLTSNRKRSANTKTRSEVRGGGKKPWKQKGTGRARAGSTRSPLWKGGGVIFGPKQKKYNSKINRKERRLAINSILYNKFLNTKVIDSIKINADKPSTKNAMIAISQIGIDLKIKQKVLLIVEKKTKNLYLSFKNIPHIELIDVKGINVMCLLKADFLIITNKALNQFRK